MTQNKPKSEIKASALDLIGNTPILALDRLWPGPGRILVKCEFMNPGASIKCRTSLYMIRNALKNGELKPGMPVVEMTSGNQGTGLSVVCAVLGLPLTITMSEGNDIPRAIHMKALGAKCVRVPQVQGTYGNVTYLDAKAAEEEALKLAEESGAYYVNQNTNKMNSEGHYQTTGPEIWRQTGGHVDAFVATVGTAGTFSGISKFLKEKNPNIKCYVAEPKGCEPISGFPITKPLHILQGSGYGCVPNLFTYETLDGTISVSDEEASYYKDLIGKKEGLYVGFTSGANVGAAVKLLQSGKLPRDAWIVTTLNDSGLKYTPQPDELIQST